MQSTTLSSLLGALLIVPVAAQSSLQTIYLAGNSLNSPGSVLFRATVLNPAGIVVTGFDVNCENTRNGPIGSVFDIHIYITAPGGTYAGNESNPAAWTRVAEGTSISLAQGLPTPVDTSDFFLPQGQFGMAINFVIPTGSLGTAFAYTNGTGTNQQYLDANLQLDLGSSSSGVFGSAVYTPRVFNGGVYYEAGSNAAYGPYGSGCDGGSPTGSPTLRPAAGTGVPRLGVLWEQNVGNLGPAPGPAIMVFGTSFQTWGPWQLPFDLAQFGMPGCFARIPPEASVFFVHLGTGTHTFGATLTNNPVFAGMAIGTQVVVLDPLATNPTGATITNLCAGRVGI